MTKGEASTIQGKASLRLSQPLTFEKPVWVMRLRNNHPAERERNVLFKKEARGGAARRLSI